MLYNATTDNMADARTRIVYRYKVVTHVCFLKERRYQGGDDYIVTMSQS